MAAHLKCLKYIEEMLEIAGCDIGYRACQLGNCGLRNTAKDYLGVGSRIRKLSQFLGYNGFEVTKIDFDGRKKALPIDLGMSIEDESLLGSFDLIIGYALIEHIENQYELFKNIHNLCRVGGMVILNGPAVGYYPGHGTWKYDFEFFRNLFLLCEYQALDARIMPLKHHMVPGRFCVIYASYIKTESSIFVEKEKFEWPAYDELGHKVDKELYDECKRA